MYRYDEFDAQFVAERTKQFRGQVERRLAGRLSENEFRPLRLMNGLYLQLHAYMLRVAIPYGTLSSEQFRMLAHLAEKYDRGYGHVTTRQNMQYNWPKLPDVPDMLDDLASLQMHAIQTSGNCIRNVTCDPYAGATAEEIIGIQIVKNTAGEVGYKIIVGGGLGRTPIIGQTLREFLPKPELLAYLTATLRIYNRYGRRDNKYKARIKILVQETGIEAFTEQVEAEYATIDIGEIAVSQAEKDRITAYFASPEFESLTNDPKVLLDELKSNKAFSLWAKNNVADHKASGYAIANISLKPKELAPGDITAEQMRVVSDLADKYSFGELRTTHQQNLVLPHVKQADLPALFADLEKAGLASDNINLITDIICCPGMDFCALATARSIPISQAIAERFADPERQRTIGEMQIKISGCINACGHHHVGHIGILGLEKAGVEFYQVKLGGDASEDAAIGKVTGPGFSQEELIDGIENMVEFYLKTRKEGERFLDTYKRIGIAPFKEVLYA